MFSGSDVGFVEMMESITFVATLAKEDVFKNMQQYYLYIYIYIYKYI